MRWNTQPEVVRLSASTGRIDFDQLRRRLDQPNASSSANSGSTADPGANAPGLID